jgi:hypothetical protein
VNKGVENYKVGINAFNGIEEMCEILWKREGTVVSSVGLCGGLLNE